MGPGILHISAAPVLGGAQGVMLTLAEDQRSHGFEVLAATGPGGPLAERLRGLGFPTLETPLEDGLQVRSILRLRRFVRRHGVRMVHAHGARALLHAFWATRRMPGVRLLSHVHLFDAWRFDGSRLGRLDRWISSRCDRVVACSTRLRQQLVSRQGLPAERTVDVPNGVDLRRFEGLPGRAEARARLGLPRDELVVGTCVRLEPTKGVGTLLEAVARLSGSWPRLQLAVAGDGSLRAELEAAARGLGLQDRVHWLGFRSDVPAVLAALDIFVLPSLVEGLPLAVLEAMAAGVPVIGTGTEGTQELIDEGRGLCVRPGSAEELAHALAGLAASPERRRELAEKARAFVHARHSVGAMSGAIRQIYAELL